MARLHDAQPASRWIRNEITHHPWIWGALGLCLALLLLAVYWPPLAEVLPVVGPGSSEWAMAISLSLVPLIAGQLSLIPRFRARGTRETPGGAFRAA